jgi:hypothetical protein
MFSALAAASHPRPASGNPSGLRHRAFISPEEIRAADTRTLAKLLVRRLHQECDLAGAPDPEQRRLGGDFEIMMMIPSETIASIVKYGFLNQHQTLTSKGFQLVAARFAAEQELAMMRLPYDRKGRELLPKYALLNVRKAGFGSFPLPTRYGDVAVVFKKEVEERAPWTYADSLDYSQRTGRYKSGGASNPVLARTTLYPGKSADRNACGNYCEAQIWGKLSWGDVDYVMIGSSRPVPSSVLAAGTRVYRYAAAVNPGQTAQFVRGEPVAAPPGREAAAVGDAPPAVARFLTGEVYAGMKDEELARRVEASASEAEESPASSERRRMLGELAARRKTPVVARELGKAAGSADATARSLALYGLSELPWKDFKPYLLAGLKDADPRVAVEAIAFASEHGDDAEVSGRLEELKSGIESRSNGPRRSADQDVEEWLERFRKARFCDEER